MDRPDYTTDSPKAQKLRQHIKRWRDAWRENDKHYHDMMSFVMGDQWDQDELDNFTKRNKQGLTFNKLAPLANYVMGQQQQNTPSLKLEATDDTPPAVVAIRQAIVLDILLNSDAKSITQNSFFQKLIGGYGAYRVGTDYDNDYNFDQVLKLYDFTDPTKCFWSLDCEHKNKIDSMISGYTVKMSRKKVRALWGREVESNIGLDQQDNGANVSVDDQTDMPLEFWDDESVTILYVYERKYKPFTLCELSNGKSFSKKEVDALPTFEVDGKEFIDYNGEPVKVVRTRKVQRYKVINSIWAGDYKIDEVPFHSQYSPVIFEDQRSYYDKKGRQITRSFFANAKDAQRYLNYIKTQNAYLLTVFRYDQFLISKENARGSDTKQIWADPTIILGALYYDEAKSGNIPQQLKPPEISQSLMQQYDSTLNDLSSSTGIYGTQLGQGGQEVSGDAIDSRRETASYNTQTLFTSSNQALWACGLIVDDAISRIYDTERKLRLNMPDTGEQTVTINKQGDEYGENFENDITKGKYRLRLLPGKSVEGQKREDQETIELILQKNPESFNLVADLFIETLENSKSIEIRNRLRAALVPPEIIEAGKTGKPIPPKAPPPNPELLKIQLEMMKAQQDFTLEQQKLMQKQHEIEANSRKDGTDAAIELGKLHQQSQELEARYVETERKLQTEMARIQADITQGHHDNLAKILTHNTSFLDKPKQAKTNSTIAG